MAIIRQPSGWRNTRSRRDAARCAGRTYLPRPSLRRPSRPPRGGAVRGLREEGERLQREIAQLRTGDRVRQLRSRGAGGRPAAPPAARRAGPGRRRGDLPLPGAGRGRRIVAGRGPGGAGRNALRPARAARALRRGDAHLPQPPGPSRTTCTAWVCPTASASWPCAAARSAMPARYRPGWPRCRPIIPDRSRLRGSAPRRLPSSVKPWRSCATSARRSPASVSFAASSARATLTRATTAAGSSAAAPSPARSWSRGAAGR